MTKRLQKKSAASNKKKTAQKASGAPSTITRSPLKAKKKAAPSKAATPVQKASSKKTSAKKATSGKAKSFDARPFPPSPNPADHEAEKSVKMRVSKPTPTKPARNRIPSGRTGEDRLVTAYVPIRQPAREVHLHARAPVSRAKR